MAERSVCSEEMICATTDQTPPGSPIAQLPRPASRGAPTKRASPGGRAGYADLSSPLPSPMRPGRAWTLQLSALPTLEPRSIPYVGPRCPAIHARCGRRLAAPSCVHSSHSRARCADARRTPRCCVTALLRRLWPLGWSGLLIIGPSPAQLEEGVKAPPLGYIRYASWRPTQ